MLGRPGPRRFFDRVARDPNSAGTYENATAREMLAEFGYASFDETEADEVP